MPGMSGFDLLERLLGSDPRFRAIAASPDE
jgi:hypothetical protein